MILLFGNSGHASELENLLARQKIAVDFFVVRQIDIKNHVTQITEERLQRIIKEYNNTPTAYLGIGEKLIRQNIFKKFPDFVYPNLFKEDSLSTLKRLIMGIGNVIFENTSISVNCNIGSFNHINTFTSISHDFKCDDYNTISPGVTIAGNVTMGSQIFIGAGATIIDRIEICSNTVIGAGSVVVKNIEEPGLYYGSPAKLVSKL